MATQTSRLGLARAVPDLGGPRPPVDLYPAEARRIAALRAAQGQGKASRNPALESFGSGKNWGLILIALFGATAPEGVVWYTGQFYALFYMTTVLKINYVTVYIIMMIALTAGGAVLYRVRRAVRPDRPPQHHDARLRARGGHLLASIHLDGGTFKDNPVMLTILVFYLVILVTMVYGPIAAFLVELFPARIRYTSMSLPYHVGNGVFGGLVPAAGASIAAITGVALSGLLYPMAIAAIGVVVSLAFMREPTHQVRIWDEVGGARRWSGPALTGTPA